MLLASFSSFGQFMTGEAGIIAQTVGTSCGSVYAAPFTLDHTLCGGSNSTNFSKLYSWSDNSLKDIAHGGKVVNTGGNYYDIEFASSATSIADVAANLYSWVIVYYDPVNGVLVAFNNIPAISHTSDVVGYLVIGNSCINSFQGGTTAFDAFTAAVYPMTNGAILSAVDISGNANNGIITGCTASATAQVPSGSAAFSGTSQYIQIGNAVSIQITSQLTIEALINPANFSNYNGIVSKTVSNFPSSWDSYLDQSNGRPVFLRGNHGASTLYAVEATSVGPTTNVWSYIGLVDEANTFQTGMHIYLNGSNLSLSTVAGGPSTPADGGTNAMIGTRSDHATMFNGLMQYIIISSTARSADWETTRWNDFMGNLTTYGSPVQIF